MEPLSAAVNIMEDPMKATEELSPKDMLDTL